MTNVSAVEKMAELMQQMEENSPRVAALEYCLKLVGDKMKEAEKRSAELEAICAALAAEVQAVKSAALEEIEVINRGGQAYCVKDGMSVNPIYARGWNDCRAKSLSVETPATDAFLAEVRASAIEHAASERWGSGYVFDELNDFAAQLRKGVQS